MPLPLEPYVSPRGAPSSLKEMLLQQDVEQQQSGERGRVLSREAYLAQQRKTKGPSANSARGFVAQPLPTLPTKPNSATLHRPPPLNGVPTQLPRPHTSRGVPQPHSQEIVDPTTVTFVEGGYAAKPRTPSSGLQRDASRSLMYSSKDSSVGSKVSALSGLVHVSTTSGHILLPERTSETMAARQMASRYNNNYQNDPERSTENSFHEVTSGGRTGRGGELTVSAKIQGSIRGSIGSSVTSPPGFDLSLEDNSTSSTQPGNSAMTPPSFRASPRNNNEGTLVVPTPPSAPKPTRGDGFQHVSVNRYSLEHPLKPEHHRSVLSECIDDLCGILSEYRELRIGVNEDEREKLAQLSLLANWNELRQLSGSSPTREVVRSLTMIDGGGGYPRNVDSRSEVMDGEAILRSVQDAPVQAAHRFQLSPATDALQSENTMSPLLWQLYNRASVAGVASRQSMPFQMENASEQGYLGSGAATPYLPTSYTHQPSALQPQSIGESVAPLTPGYRGSLAQPRNRPGAPTPPSSMSVGPRDESPSSPGLSRPPRPTTPACASRQGATPAADETGNERSLSVPPAAVAPVAVPSVPADLVDWMCTTCQDMLAEGAHMADVLSALVEQVQQYVPDVYTLNVWVYSTTQDMLYRIDNERIRTLPLSGKDDKRDLPSTSPSPTVSNMGRPPISKLVDSSHNKVSQSSDARPASSIDNLLGPTLDARPNNTADGDQDSTVSVCFLTKLPRADSNRIVIPLFLAPTSAAALTSHIPTKEGVYGVLEILGIRGSELDSIDPTQSAVLCSVGSFVYTILHHNRSREREDRRIRSIDSVVKIANELANVSNLDENKLVNDVMDLIVSVCEAERAALFLPGDNNDLVAFGGEGQVLRVPRGLGIVGHVAETGAGICVEDAYSCPFFYEESDRQTNFKTKAVMCHPVFYEGCIVAYAELLNKKTKCGSTGAFNREDEGHFVNLLALVGLCLRSCKKNRDLVVEKSKMEALFASVLEISATDITQLGSVLSTVVDTACTLGHPIFTHSFVVRYDVELQQLLVDPSLFPTYRRPRRPSASEEMHQADNVNESEMSTATAGPKRFEPTRGIAGLCYTSGEVQLALNLTSEESPFDSELDTPFLTAIEAANVSAILSIPLMSGSDVIGVLQFVRLEGALVDPPLTNDSLSGSESKPVMAVVNPGTRPQSSSSQTSRGTTPQMMQQQNRGGSASRSRDTTGGSWLTLRQSPVPIDRWTTAPLPLSPLLPKSSRPPTRQNHTRPLANQESSEAGFSIIYQWDGEVGPTHELISLLKGFAVFAAIWIHNADLIDFTVKAGKAVTKLSTIFRSQRPGARSHVRVDRAEVNLVLRTHVPDVFANTIASPEFNLWAVRQNTDIAPLLVASRVVFDLLWSTGLPQQFRCREETLATFIVACRSKYRPVPYHNFFHAVDVTQTIFHFMYTGGVAEMLTPLEQYVAMIVGLTHDLDHMGLNNNYHMKTDTPLGILSSVGGTQSVLEVRHCNLAVEILSSDEANVFEGLVKEDVTTAYHLLIEAILGTDMAKHASCVHQLKNWDAGSFDFNKSEHRKFAFDVVVKIADISNVSKPFEISKQWAVAVTEEFSQQGDREKRQGISEILPQFDREKNADLAKGQLGFIQFVAQPFFALVVEKLFPGMQYALDNIHENVDVWRKLQQN